MILTEELTRTSLEKKVNNFQRNVHAGHLVFQNEANFSPSMAMTMMSKIDILLITKQHKIYCHKVKVGILCRIQPDMGR